MFVGSVLGQYFFFLRLVQHNAFMDVEESTVSPVMINLKILFFFLVCSTYRNAHSVNM